MRPNRVQAFGFNCQSVSLNFTDLILWGTYMFAFYDFETTGTSPKYDQPIQFAANLTDDDFNQVERINIRCRLSLHIIPAPWALAVTGVTPETLTDSNLPS